MESRKIIIIVIVKWGKKECMGEIKLISWSLKKKVSYSVDLIANKVMFPFFIFANSLTKCSIDLGGFQNIARLLWCLGGCLLAQMKSTLTLIPQTLSMSSNSDAYLARAT